MHDRDEPRDADTAIEVGAVALASGGVTMHVATPLDRRPAVPDTTLMLIVLALLATVGAVARKARTPGLDEEEWPEVDVVIDLDFLRARPAELDQRISELVAMSGDATLGARMRSIQLASEPTAPRPAGVRRRAHPLVASR